VSRSTTCSTIDRGNGASSDLVLLLMFTTFLAQWTGRQEWHTRVRERGELESLGPTSGASAGEL
jgi:hypothetical protein